MLLTLLLKLSFLKLLLTTTLPSLLTRMLKMPTTLPGTMFKLPKHFLMMLITSLLLPMLRLLMPRML
jgi:hypothetical protein